MVDGTKTYTQSSRTTHATTDACTPAGPIVESVQLGVAAINANASVRN
jgi:hypothetical protein